MIIYKSRTFYCVQRKARFNFKQVLFLQNTTDEYLTQDEIYYKPRERGKPSYHIIISGLYGWKTYKRQCLF